MSGHREGTLRRLTDWKDEVTIVPYSGIQILDFGFSIDQVRFRRRFLEHRIGEDETRIERMLAPLTGDQDKDAEIEARAHADDPPPYSIDEHKALDPFLGEWVPVPVLRLKKERGPGGQERFDPGPSAWARMRVVELDSPEPSTGNTHRVQMALDTTLVPENPALQYLAPERADAETPREFRFVADPRLMSWFLRRLESPDAETQADVQLWVSDWLKELFFRHLRATRGGRPVNESSLPRQFEHWARYLTYLGLLESALSIPRLRFANTVSARDAVPPVEVDLVLDVGNSRTCGILVERFPGDAEVRLAQSYPLEIRDLSRPEFHYSGLIDSRVEFAELSMGEERFASRSGRRGSFLWPGFVRVGPEALRLVQSEEGTETKSGLSSPKRYLWDDQALSQDWRFHNHLDPNNLPRGVRATMQYVNESGDVIEQVRYEEEKRLRPKNKTSQNRAIRPRFSRSSCFGFMLAELFAHALVQVNDPAARARRPQSDLPRRLSRIILTLPTATPVQEQAIMRSRAAGALKLVWAKMGIDETASVISARPDLIVDWDEASCTQLVYLYSEITQKFEGRIDSYFDLMGRPRPRGGAGPDEPSLRLACIDIGGGTTDLMITTYHSEAGRVLHPDQNFREGFRVAGDDLVQQVISRIVIPRLRKSIEEAGGQFVTERLSALFGGDVGGQDQQSIQQRRQFTLRVLAPMAVTLLEGAETAEENEILAATTDDVFGTRPVEDDRDDPETALASRLALPDELLSYLEAPAQSLGAEGWTLDGLTISAERAELDAVARDLFQATLGNMVEVIDHMGCDAVLLTGRPSRLPAIRAIVEETMAVPPDRLVSMHHYRTDRWYPYRDPVTHRIGDPKSTVAVGGMLIALSGSRVPNFKVMTDAYRMRSTARYIGEMDLSGQITEDRVVFSDVDLDRGRGVSETTAELKMFTPIHLGMRQLPLERWTTTPLYRLDFANAAAHKLKSPLTLTLERADPIDEDDLQTAEDRVQAEVVREAFQVTGLEDADGGGRPSDVTLKLHTLGFEDEYWLDTGTFRIG